MCLRAEGTTVNSYLVEQGRRGDNEGEVKERAREKREARRETIEATETGNS